MLNTPRYHGSRREFCGPTAIAAVTGEDFDTIRDAIRQASGKIETADGRAHPVMGVKPKHIVGAMRLLGWRVTEHVETENENNRRDVLTINDFLYVSGNEGPFIVNVTGHYYAVSHGEICDTYTKLPMDIARFRKRGQWVRNWWKFEKAIGDSEESARASLSA